MTEIHSGNAKIDGADSRGWIVGSFMPDGVRHSDTTEIKYGIHTAGEARTEWVGGEKRKTLFILLQGIFVMEFIEQTVILERPGDYVMWGPGVSHKWNSPVDSIGLTVRWIEAK